MSKIPADLKYTHSHEWVRMEADGTMKIGITDHAQSLLGDLVFIDLPAVDSDLVQGEEAGVVESVKAASDIYAPLSGKVIAVNEELVSSPEIVNDDPYEAGWLFAVQPTDPNDWQKLLDAKAYEHLIHEE